MSITSTSVCHSLDGARSAIRLPTVGVRDVQAARNSESIQQLVDLAAAAIVGVDDLDGLDDGRGRP